MAQPAWCASSQSKGFELLERSSDTEAQAAISTFDGQEHSGLALTVNEAKPRTPVQKALRRELFLQLDHVLQVNIAIAVQVGAFAF